jgi:hypothetical protein
MVSDEDHAVHEISYYLPYIELGSVASHSGEGHAGDHDGRKHKGEGVHPQS